MIMENVGTVIISAVVSITLGLITYFGANKRAQIDARIAESNAAKEATKAENELDLKLSERVDRLRAKLWEDVEEKMAEQAERIAAQGKRIEEQDRRIEKEVKARKNLEIVVEKQAKQIKQLEGELKEKDAIIARLRNGGSDYTPASL